MNSDSFPLRRREVTARLLARRGDALVVGGLGSPAWDITAAGDDDTNFPLWGAMGGAVPIGLGLALAQPDRRVLVVTGDGEMLMGLGSLATVAVQSPVNLAIAVLDNECYGETGMQATHTADGVDLAAIAAAAGIARSETVRQAGELAAAASRFCDMAGPVFMVIKVRAESPPLVLPPRDGVVLKDRFRAALLGPDASS